MGKQSLQRAVPLALVHHANQYLITDGYPDRQGISQIAEGYTRLLQMHERYYVPLNLHLSGTLLETLAWHHPCFLNTVRTMSDHGLLTLIGGTYAENVMTLFAPSFNIQQLNEHLWLYHRHLGCSPTEITICWIPERVWNTGLLANTLTCDLLANGGYRYVLLDDRLLYPLYKGSYQGSPRALFDATGPYPAIAPPDVCFSCGKQMLPHTASCRVSRIADTHNLAMIPISAHLRYWIPPTREEHRHALIATACRLASEWNDDMLLVYADDLERAAGVGGWDESALERYESFLQWLVSDTIFMPVHLSRWLACHLPQIEQEVEAGTFYEIAQEKCAGESYRAWTNCAAWSPYQQLFDVAQQDLKHAQQARADECLLELARKHLMASTYETAWHDLVDGKIVPAGWAKALASHVRAVHVMIAAARWFAQRNRPLSTAIVDIDRDGCEEVLLRSATLYAVLSPRQGGRIIYLFTLTEKGGVLVIGNPSDDWNLQQELNDYMQHPPNHPGALADKGYERDTYAVVASEISAGVSMTNVRAGSNLFGACKSVRILPQSQQIAICYRLPNTLKSLDTIICFSPDYYRLLREGPAQLRPIANQRARGFAFAETTVWVARPDDDEIRWVEPEQARVGHGMNVQIRLEAAHAHLLIGCGAIDDNTCSPFLNGRGCVFDNQMLDISG